MTKTPIYDEWQHLRTHGVWSDGVPDWARDHFGQMNDVTATVAVINELAGVLASLSTASVSEPDNSQAVALREVQEQRRFEAYFRDGETREFWENANPRQIANAAWFAALSTPASKEQPTFDEIIELIPAEKRLIITKDR